METNTLEGDRLQSGDVKAEIEKLALCARSALGLLPDKPSADLRPLRILLGRIAGGLSTLSASIYAPALFDLEARLDQAGTDEQLRGAMIGEFVRQWTDPTAMMPPELYTSNANLKLAEHLRNALEASYERLLERSVCGDGIAATIAVVLDVIHHETAAFLPNC